MKWSYQMIPVAGEPGIHEVLNVFQSNPAYFELTKGTLADRTDVLDAMSEKPAEVPLVGKHTMLIQRLSGSLDSVAVVDWLDDYPYPGTHYLGLFMTAGDLHGTGESRVILDWLFDYFQSDGAKSVRLGVIAQNQRALRFWKHAGFSEVRRATHNKGILVHEVVIMDKAL